MNHLTIIATVLGILLAPRRIGCSPFIPCDPCKQNDSTVYWIRSSTETQGRSHLHYNMTCSELPAFRESEQVKQLDERDPRCQEIKAIFFHCTTNGNADRFHQIEHNVNGPIPSNTSVGACPRPPVDTRCTICLNPDDTLQSPHKQLPQSFSHPFHNETPTCAAYQHYLSFIEETNPICVASRAFLQQYCGCSSLPSFHLRQNGGCSTCPASKTSHNSMILNPSKKIALPMLPFQTCAELDRATTFLLNETSDYCQYIQSFSNICGCSLLSEPEITPGEGEKGENNRPQQKCVLCVNGDLDEEAEAKTAQFFTGQKLVPFLKNIYGVPTCEMVQAFASTIDSDSQTCRELQKTAGSYCGCPAVHDACEFQCGALEPQYKNQIVTVADGSRGDDVGDEGTTPLVLSSRSEDGGGAPIGFNDITFTCEAFYATQYHIPASSQECQLARLNTRQCGCQPINDEKQYRGASTKREQRVLVRIARFVGTISMIVSALVLIEIAITGTKRSNTFHQIIFLIALFDFMTAVVWIVGPASLPSNQQAHDDNNELFLGGHGNWGTCKIHGFFRQLGQTSIFMTVSLAIFYYRVIVCQWKEQQHLRRYQKYFLGVPVFLGICLALFGLPAITEFPLGCQIKSTPTITTTVGANNDNDRVILFKTAYTSLVTIPIYLATQVIVISLGITLWKAPSQNRKLAHRRMPTGLEVRDRLESEIVWQNTWFTLSFLLSWPIWGIAMMFPTHFELWVFVVSLAPLSGTTNGITYFYPRILQRRQQEQEQRELRERRKERWRTGSDDFSTDSCVFNGRGNSTLARKMNLFRWKVWKGTQAMLRSTGQIVGRKAPKGEEQTHPQQEYEQEHDQQSPGGQADDLEFEDITGLLRTVV